MSLASVLFHSPAIVAAALIAVRTSSRCSARLRDTFLITLFVWRAEHLLLGSIGELNALGIGITHCAVLAATWFLVRGHPVLTEVPEQQRTPPVSAVAGAWMAMALGVAWLRSAAYPDPYDSLTYHLMLPATWISNGGLSLLPTYFGDIAPSYTPESVESCFAMLMAPFGDDALARIGQLPFAALAGYSVARLASPDKDAHLGPNAALAAVVFLTLPEVLDQSSSSMVDLASAALLLSSFEQLRRSASCSTERQRWIRIALAGATAGLFLSSRFTSLVFAPMFLLPLVMALGTHTRRWTAFAGTSFLFGCYPYLRNWALTGNPVYPVEVAGLPGLFTREATFANRYHLRDLSAVWELISHRYGAVGLSVVAIGVFAPWAWITRRSQDARQAMALSACAALGIALHFGLIPYNANSRFLFAAWGCAVAATGLVARMFPRAIPMLVAAVLGLAVACFGVADLLERASAAPFASIDTSRVAPLALAALALLGAASGWAFADRLSRRWQVIVLTVCLVGGVGALDVASHYRRSNWVNVVTRDLRFGDCRPGIAAIERLDRATIAYAGRNAPYLLRGSDGRHRVVFVPADGSNLNALPHELTGDDSPASTTRVQLMPDRTQPSQVKWWKRLLEEQVEYVAVFGPHVIEAQWATNTPGLRAIETRGGLAIYQVIPR